MSLPAAVSVAEVASTRLPNMGAAYDILAAPCRQPLPPLSTFHLALGKSGAVGGDFLRINNRRTAHQPPATSHQY